MTRTEELNVTVIGAGNWGSSLIAALRAAGLGPREIIRRKGWQRARFDARIIWLCLPDAEIAAVAEKLVARAQRLRGENALRGQIVVHSSGALSADVLEPARRAGAKIASVHPVMTFPTRRVVPLQGVMFGIEAHGPSVRRELSSLVKRMGGVPFAVKPEAKALYHAAGVMASPLLVSTLTAATETARLAGLDEKTAAKWVRSLSEATASNVFAHGPRSSFSGPFARGDAATITLHLEALNEHPILAGVYRSLAHHAVYALPVKNRRALLKAIGTGARTLK
ncbi:MAG TPA: Rossmann-like and DUF2520 domain-containing protein [Terracidiphilus sp.]